MKRTGLVAALALVVSLLAGVGCRPHGFGEIPTAGPAYDELDIGAGARFGEWIAWRPDPNHLLLTHAGDRVAIEIWTTSNGWFRYAAHHGTYVVWSVATQSEQSFDLNYVAYFNRDTELDLGHKAAAIGTYRIRFEDGRLLLVCTANQEAIEISPHASGFLFHGLRDKTIELPME